MPADPPRTTVITNAMVFDGSGRPPFAGATITIRGDRIEAVTPPPLSESPSADEVIAGDGMTVLPGLIDMHTHLFWEEVLPQFLAYGVTTVRDVGNDVLQIARLADWERQGAIASPRIFFCGPPLEGDPPMLESPHQVVLSEPDDAAPIVDQLVDAGASTIKLYMGITAELMEAAVAQANNREVPVTAHLGRVSSTTAANLGLTGLEHVAQGLYADLVPPEALLEADDRGRLGLPGFWEQVMAGWAIVDLDGTASRRVIDLLVQKQMYLVPTLGTQECKGMTAPGDEVPASQFILPETMRTRWDYGHSMMTGGWQPAARDRARAAFEKMKGFVCRFSEAGGEIVAGSDVSAPFIVPGASLHRELELMVDSGMSQAAALHAATGAAAKVLRQSHRLGTIEPGKLADLVLVKGNPCADISHVRRISMVLKGGERVPLATFER